VTPGLPPRPHDPRDRAVVADLGIWQARQFAVDDAKLAYFAPRGFLHLQLWHAGRGVSVLTPSRITGGRYETWAADGERIAAWSWDEIQELLVGLAVPGQRRLAALEAWFVKRHEPRQVHLLRRWWAEPTRRRA
jgi:hypothetical protein